MMKSISSVRPTTNTATHDLRSAKGRLGLLSVVQSSGFEAGRQAVGGEAKMEPPETTIFAALLSGQPIRTSTLDRRAFDGLNLAVRGDRLNDYEAVQMGLQILYDIGFARP